MSIGGLLSYIFDLNGYLVLLTSVLIGCIDSDQM